MRHLAGTCGLGVELGVDCLFKPSTVSRWFSAVAGFYRACVFDGLLEHSAAEHVRRPSVPAESPVLCFTHLQFEALLTAARDSSSRYDSALVAMLGLLGLRIFEARPLQAHPDTVRLARHNLRAHGTSHREES